MAPLYTASTYTYASVEVKDTVLRQNGPILTHSELYWLTSKSKIPKEIMNFELSLGMVQSKRSNVFSGSQFGWFGCVKTECSRSWLDDGCQRLGRSNDFSTNINWKDFSRSCLLTKESFVGIPLNDVVMTSLWHNITWMYEGEREKSIGALVIYFIDSSDPIETCKNFYSVLGSTLVWFVSQ